MIIEGKFFRILYFKGVVVKKGNELRNHCRLHYDELIKELANPSRGIVTIKNIFHDDKNPSRKGQLTGKEVLQVWADVSRDN